MCYGYCAERSFSVTTNTHDGPLGAHRLYQSPAQVVIYAPAHLSLRSTSVSILRANLIKSPLTFTILHLLHLLVADQARTVL